MQKDGLKTLVVMVQQCAGAHLLKAIELMLVSKLSKTAMTELRVSLSEKESFLVVLVSVTDLKPSYSTHRG